MKIPKSELGKQYLWNTQIAKTTMGVGYGGGQLAEHVVAWELHNNRVYLQEINFSITASADSPIASAVKNANNDTIIMSFNVAAFHDGDPVIDVSRLYNTDVPEFSARQHIGATAFDASRSFIDHISTFPENIEAESTATYTRSGGNAAAGGGGRGGGLGGGTMRGTSATIVLHHSMVRLPEHPMMPRLFDERGATSPPSNRILRLTNTASAPRATLRAGGSKRKTRTRRSLSPLSRLFITSMRPRRRSGCRG